ncbi:carbonic anhydrase [Kitasatospora sp. MAP12-15]|uniref:carbonic anhydrase n=1 Tax=unclassified Kitasatospora TaxID=2633591 RepID=UPI002474D981|nr:carbonic anhydrase [Kitasatospora sp. MAP12-44]MDH6109847.1 carbonic anhydrase [Kitasatospora sp. MAP12-44]
MVSRRAVLGRAVLGAGALGVLPGARAGDLPAARAAGVGRPGSAAEALRRLRDGNDNWVANRARHPDASLPRRQDLADGQAPFAVVFSCIDSRVPPELVFDQGLGDLLVVRTAAHTLDRLVTGSLEYGPAELATPLLVVLGHQRCGAVTAAVRAFEAGEPLPGHLADVAQDLRAPYEAVASEVAASEAAPGGLVEAVVREQTRQVVEQLRADRLLAPLVGEGRLLVCGAYYSLDTGTVGFAG